MAIQPAGSRSFRPFPNNHSAVAIWLMLALLSARAEAEQSARVCPAVRDHRCNRRWRRRLSRGTQAEGVGRGRCNMQASVLSHKFLVFQRSQNSPVQGAIRRQYLDIGKKRNAVMVDSVISRRARPARLLAVLRPLAREQPFPADRAYPETWQAALNY